MNGCSQAGPVLDAVSSRTASENLSVPGVPVSHVNLPHLTQYIRTQLSFSPIPKGSAAIAHPTERRQGAREGSGGLLVQFRHLAFTLDTETSPCPQTDRRRHLSSRNPHPKSIPKAKALAQRKAAGTLFSATSRNRNK